MPTTPETDPLAFAERLQEVLADHNVKAHGAGVMLAAKYGVSGPTVTGWLRGKHLPGADRVQRMALDYGVNFEWLMFGAGPKPRNGNQAEASNVEDALPPRELAWAPVVGRVKGGLDGFIEEEAYAVGHSDEYIPYRGKDPNAFGLRVIGDSMSPRYNHGEYLVGCPSLPYRQGKYVYVSLHDGSKLVKRLGQETEDAWELLSVNNSYKPCTVEKKDIATIVVVQGPFEAEDVRRR